MPQFFNQKQHSRFCTPAWSISKRIHVIYLWETIDGKMNHAGINGGGDQLRSFVDYLRVLKMTVHIEKFHGDQSAYRFECHSVSSCIENCDFGNWIQGAELWEEAPYISAERRRIHMDHGIGNTKLGQTRPGPDSSSFWIDKNNIKLINHFTLYYYIIVKFFNF